MHKHIYILVVFYITQVTAMHTTTCTNRTLRGGGGAGAGAVLVLTVSLSQDVSMGETVRSGSGARTADLRRDPAALGTDWTEGCAPNRLKPITKNF